MMNLRTICRGLLGIAIVALVGCGGGGGGGYSGSTAPAAISGTNAEEIGVDTTEAAAKAIEADSADTSGLPFGVSVTDGLTPSQQAQNINQKIMETMKGSSLPLGITLGSSYFNGDTGYCGGSITVPDNFDTTNGTITYNNFCMDSGTLYGQMTVNGSATFSDGGASISYNNFTISFENGTYLSCNGSSLSPTSCTSNIVYAGSGGTTYRVSDVSVSGDATSGYNINASYCHSTYGCLTIETTSPIVLDPPCSNGKPSSGSISYSSTNGSSGTITFNSCSSYTVTYVVTAGGAVNSISGAW